MTDLGARLQRVIEEIVGNEALLEMLETEAASEMLNWGTTMATSLVKGMTSFEDDALDLALLPRLKAIRQTMRSVGNWSVGKYVSPEDRLQLRDKLIGYFKAIFGEDAHLPSADQLDELLDQADDRALSPHQLILKLRDMLESYIHGGNHAQT
jgi:hypothetical protein